MNRVAACLLLVSFAGSLEAQSYDQPGPFPVGWQDVDFTDPVLGGIDGIVYYPSATGGPGAPADPSGGPYPLHGFMHGFLSPPTQYDSLCEHIASWGYVVASIGTNTGFIASPESEGEDTQALMQWVAAASGLPGDPFEGLVSETADWSASGHSMGGGALQTLIGLEPRVRAVAPLQGVFESGAAQANLQAFTGAVYYLAGSTDFITPPGVHADPWFAAATSAGRAVLSEVQGMGHIDVLDGFEGTTGHRLHRELVVALLEAEVRGHEDAWYELVGGGLAGEPVDESARCSVPPLWALASPAQPGAAVIGLAGEPTELAVVLASPAPALAPIPTPFGLVGISPVGVVELASGVHPATGWSEGVVPVPPGLTGVTVYVQAFSGTPSAGALTRTAELVLP